MARNDAKPDEAWIRVGGIEFHHGRIPVLRDVNLDFRPGRHYIVAGPNGAGKSTLLDILSNLRVPSAGSVEIMGHSPGSYRPSQLARLLALAPQEYRFNFAFTIREVVSMGRRPYLGRWGILSAEDEAIVDTAIAKVHLEALSSRPITALSGGERRRCIVARALAQTTPIVLLDEPCSGLDVAQALSVMELGRGLAEEGALVVTVSHDLNLAATFGHEMIFLKHGRVAASGPVEEVFADGVLSEVYDTDARVREDAFSGGYTVSFRAGGERRA